MAVAPPSAAGEKLTAAELLARHLDSIGSPEAREAARTRVIRGRVRAAFRMAGIGQAAGTARLLSQDGRVLLGMEFGRRDYREQLSFDGERVEVTLLGPGRRSPLGPHFGAGSGLNLPHTYRIQLSQQMKRGTLLHDWTLSLEQFELSASRVPLDFLAIPPY